MAIPREVSSFTKLKLFSLKRLVSTKGTITKVFFDKIIYYCNNYNKIKGNNYGDGEEKNYLTRVVYGLSLTLVGPTSVYEKIERPFINQSHEIHFF